MYTELSEENSKSFQIHEDATSKTLSSFSTCFFNWLHPLLSLGNFNLLDIKNLKNLPEKDKSFQDYVKFKEKADFLLKFSTKRVIIKSFFYVFYWKMLKCIFYFFLTTVFSYCLPIIIHSTIKYVENPNKNLRDGILLVISAFVLKFCYVISFSHMQFQMAVLGISMSNALSISIFKKSLNVSLMSSYNFTEGELVNFIQVDVEKIYLFPQTFSSCILLPVQLFFAIAIMLNMIGYSFFVGMAGIFLLIFIIFLLGKCMEYIQNNIMLNKDKRLKIANEIFSLISIIKLNVWEEFFLKKIKIARNKELCECMKDGIVHCIMMFAIYLSPFFVLCSTFGFHSYLGKSFHAAEIFTVVATFKLILYPLGEFPCFFIDTIKAFIAMNRIESFIVSKELDKEYIKKLSSRTKAVRVSKGNFFWEDKNSIVLKNFEIDIEKGSVVGIIGEVGSGKSTFLSAVIGEISAEEGSEIELGESVCYVPQISWILSGSVKENILFGEEEQEKKLEKVVELCCLKQDLDIFPNGIETIIGEKGANLSGGQKARICLARAVYSEKSIILLDDPLSALDMNVGQKIMEQCFLNYLKNSGKTLIIVTHSLQYLKYMDYIYVLSEGGIILKGSYSSLQNNSKFQELYTRISDEKSNTPNKIVRKTSYESEHSIEEIFSQIIEEKNLQNNISLEKLLDEDELEKRGIQSSTYIYYFRRLGGFFFLLSMLIVFTIWSSSMIGMDLWLAHWTTASDRKNLTFYLKFYVLLSLLYAFSAFVRSLIIFCSNLNVLKEVHQEMMKCLTEASIPLFFQKNSSGRILNRLSKDISILEGEIWWILGTVFANIFVFIGDIFFCVYAVSLYMIFPVVLFLIGIIHFLLRSVRIHEPFFITV